jgi:hypothetical protein
MKNYISQRDLDLVKALREELPPESAHIQYLCKESSPEDSLPVPLNTWLEKWKTIDFHFENKRVEKRRMGFQKALDSYSFYLITGKNPCSKTMVCDEYVRLISEVKKTALEPSWRASKPHSPRQEIFWIIVASILWTPIFAPLWIKQEESAGFQADGIIFTGIFLLSWVLFTSIYYVKKSGPIFIGRYRIRSAFIYVFAIELVTLLGRALMIAKYGPYANF